MSVYDTPPEYLDECLVSIVNQSGLDFEVVLVDDGSRKNKTVRSLDAWGVHSRVELLRLDRNYGPGYAANCGLKKACAELVARMGADDRMPHERRLVEQLDFMNTHHDIEVLTGQMRNIWLDGEVIELEPVTDRQVVAGQPLSEQYVLYHGTAMYRRRFVLSVGGYDTRHARGSDFRLWTKLEKGGARFHIDRRVWLERRIWPGSFTFNRSPYLQAMHKEAERERIAREQSPHHNTKGKATK